MRLAPHKEEKEQERGAVKADKRQGAAKTKKERGESTRAYWGQSCKIPETYEKE